MLCHHARCITHPPSWGPARRHYALRFYKCASRRRDLLCRTTVARPALPRLPCQKQGPPLPSCCRAPGALAEGVGVQIALLVLVAAFQVCFVSSLKNNRVSGVMVGRRVARAGAACAPQRPWCGARCSGPASQIMPYPSQPWPSCPCPGVMPQAATKQTGIQRRRLPRPAEWAACIEGGGVAGSGRRGSGAAGASIPPRPGPPTRGP